MEGSLVRSSERRSNREQMVVCKGAIWSIEFQRILDGAGSIVFFSTSSAEWRLFCLRRSKSRCRRAAILLWASLYVETARRYGAGPSLAAPRAPSKFSANPSSLLLSFLSSTQKINPLYTRDISLSHISNLSIPLYTFTPLRTDPTQSVSLTPTLNLKVKLVG